MRRHFTAVGLTTVCVLALIAAAQTDLWGPTIWTDNFEDGDWENNPAWEEFGDPFGQASRAVTTWEGDYAFRFTAPYIGDPVNGGWSGAYVDSDQGDQGILAWVDTSPLANDDWGAICVLRYSPTGGMGFGTGYACAITHTAGGAIAAQLFQADDTANPAITGPVVISGTYTDVWVRFVAVGTGTSTAVAARVWPAGQAEPTTWTLDSNTTGGEAGITNYYPTGRGGVGVVATAAGVTADAYFDDIEYCAGVLSAEPPW